MAKIVALVGSPNVSGNTAAIVNSVLDGAMGLSTNVIKYHNLWKITTFDRGEFILHCHDKKHPVIDESAQEILEDIRTADVLIFGTPVYFDMPTSQFQLILEYMYSMISTDFNDSELAGKKAVVVVSCTEIDRDSLNVVDTVAHSLGRFGIEVVDKMIYEDWKGPFKDDAEARRKAKAVGARFYCTVDVEPETETLLLNRCGRQHESYTVDRYPGRMRFGPAGYPAAAKKPEGALEYTRSIGLDALEVEFVRGARIKPERAQEIGAKAKELDIRLSCHAPYFISFNSDNPETREKSVDWVTSTARAAHNLGAYIIVIHAAAYGKSPETALDSVCEGLQRSKDVLDDEGIKDVILGVETMGKLGQFGTLKEIAQVIDRVDGVRPVLDVAHVHARGHGCLRTEQDMRDLTDEFFSISGPIAHFHISCIKYGDKGEISHLPLEAKDPDMSMLAHVLQDSRQDCTFISESPLIEKDAVVFRDMFPQYRLSSRCEQVVEGHHRGEIPSVFGSPEAECGYQNVAHGGPSGCILDDEVPVVHENEMMILVDREFLVDELGFAYAHYIVVAIYDQVHLGPRPSASPFFDHRGSLVDTPEIPRADLICGM